MPIRHNYVQVGNIFRINVALLSLNCKLNCCNYKLQLLTLYNFTRCNLPFQYMTICHKLSNLTHFTNITMMNAIFWFLSNSKPNNPLPLNTRIGKPQFKPQSKNDFSHMSKQQSNSRCCCCNFENYKKEQEIRTNHKTL